MKVSLEASYAACRRASRKSASNFLLSFWFLPREKRKAMYALYAFFRHTDDLGDNSGDSLQRQADLDTWRYQLQAALAGEFHDVRLPALVDTLRKFDIPPQYLEQSIQGVETDLYPRRFETYEQLRNYCYQVASVVGLSCIRIWGLRDDADLQPATDCGYAFQLTNILRDLKEDALSGRVYLPSEELEAFGVTREMLTSGSNCEEFRGLMRFQIARTRELFQSAERLTPSLHEDGRKIFTAMMSIYRNLLDRIAEDPEAVLHRRVRVSSWRKVKLMTSLAFSQLIPTPTLEPPPSLNPPPRPEKVRHVV